MKVNDRVCGWTDEGRITGKLLAYDPVHGWMVLWDEGTKCWWTPSRLTPQPAAWRTRKETT